MTTDEQKINHPSFCPSPTGIFRLVLRLPARPVLQIFLLLLFLGSTLVAGEAKYVFLMIGDGMGENPRKLFYQQCGPGSMGGFPVNIPTGTLNGLNRITDSAASGTALACGARTFNGALGWGMDGKPLASLAKLLRDRGYGIGIVTSVGINDATPGAYYANRKSRKEYAGILTDLAASGFDFFCGSFVLMPKKMKAKDLDRLLKDHHYTVSRDGNLDALQADRKNFVLVSTLAEWSEPRRNPSLAQVTAKAVGLLLKRSSKGFFLMVEGGEIDHMAHRNDAAGVIREMIEFDRAVAVALKFQKEHSGETLVVVTADHNTGGLTFGGKAPEVGFWKKQKKPILELQKDLAVETQMPEETVVNELTGKIGLDHPTPAEKQRLHQAWRLYADKTVTASDRMTGYGGYNPLVIEALHLRDARNGLSWTTFGHTADKVLTNVSGPGAERFKAPLKNSDIPRLICLAMLGRDLLLNELQMPESQPHSAR